MKKIIFSAISVLFCISLLFSFTSCFGNGDLQVTKSKKGPSIQMDIKPDAAGILKIKTNLPVGTKGTVRIVSKPNNVDMNVSLTVDKNKFFMSEKITTDDGKTLKDGTYGMIIATSPISEQPEEVINIIGEKGQNMIGYNVFVNEKGRFAQRITSSIVKDGKFYQSEKGTTAKAE